VNVEGARQKIAENYNKLVTTLKPYGFGVNITSKTEDYDTTTKAEWTL
jgi:hypothetical protein